MKVRLMCVVGDTLYCKYVETDLSAIGTAPMFSIGDSGEDTPLSVIHVRENMAEVELEAKILSSPEAKSEFSSRMTSNGWTSQPKFHWPV